jgi:hypothetical protein
VELVVCGSTEFTVNVFCYFLNVLMNRKLEAERTGLTKGWTSMT